MENLYRRYFDNMPCYLSVQDKDFRIVEANSRFRDAFGDIEGRYCYQVYKQRPEKCEVCPVERTFQDGLSHRSEELVTTLDGREVSVIVYTTPIYDDDGKIVSVMEMSTDITEIKQLHNQLRESQKRYRLLFEDVPCYISIQDRDLRIVDANRMHREAFGSYFGCKCYEVYKHRTDVCVPCIVMQTFDDGGIHVHEEVVCAQDDRRINVLVTTAPIYGADGEVEHVIEMSADITQIRQLQDKLTSAGLLISSISHGIKGLLNSLDGGIYLVNTGLKKNDTERINKGWEIAMRNVDRIRSMVLNILYYAKDREPNYEQISAKSLVEELCEEYRKKAEELGIQLAHKTDDAKGKFQVDPHAVRSMLINLLENSMDACRVDRNKDEHRVVLRFEDSSDSVCFEVSDNGIGMDRETREKAFSMFFSSKGAGGTGLGLFIANKIAQGHGGDISVESEVGKGTRFVVTIPKGHTPVSSETEANLDELESE
jgi:PAS domain S-box-containing protein